MVSIEKTKVWVGADVLTKLRGRILSGELAPQSRLRFSALQKELEVGIGTLREALAHLETEGFVESQDGRGYRVAPISISDLRDIVELRVQFETNALTSAIKYGDSAWEDDIVTAHHRLARVEKAPADANDQSEEAWALHHRGFHRALVASCVSAWTLRFHGILFDQAHRYRMVSRRLRDGSRTRSDEHLAIMEATLARNVPLAVSLSEQHIRDTAAIIERRLASGTSDLQVASEEQA